MRKKVHKIELMITPGQGWMSKVFSPKGVKIYQDPCPVQRQNAEYNAVEYLKKLGIEEYETVAVSYDGVS